MTTTYFTSDNHMFHPKVAKERAERFADMHDWRFPDDASHTQAAIDWQAERMAREWDSVIKPDDVVYVVGDTCMGGTATIRATIDWFADRPGRKRMVSGNHDPFHGSSRDAHKWFGEFAKVFEFIGQYARVKVGGADAIVSHYPYTGDHTAADRDVQYRMRDYGVPIIHGHTHSETAVSRSASGTVQIHVGVDARNMAPVPVHVIAAEIAEETR